MKIGSLFSGYGGLDLAVASVLGASVAWHVEFDKHPSAILAHHFPSVPNYGDVSAVHWSDVEPVDILTGGFPCQDLSTAGKRAGLRPGTRSGLWEHMAFAVSQLRPELVVIENVRGLLSAAAHSDVEPCPMCVGDDPSDALRALGAVLGDLADIGYDAQWCGLRAADAGAPHGRFRVFIVAYPSDSKHDGRNGAKVRRGVGSCEAVGRMLQPEGPRTGQGQVVAYPNDGRRWEPDAQQRGFPVVDQNGDGPVELFSTATASDRFGAGRPSGRDDGTPLLPTPAVNDMGAGKTPEQWDEWTAKMQAAHGNGNGHGNSLAIEALRLLPTPRAQEPGATNEGYGLSLNEAVTGGRLLPTPRATDGTKGGPNQRGSSGDLMLPSAAVQLLSTPTAGLGEGGGQRSHRWRSDSQRTHNPVELARDIAEGTLTDFGPYAAAVARWEATLGRPAPAPTEPGTNGKPRLSPAFVEWMMGLPAGWVTDVDIPRNAQLKALGNGVVPQQAALALRLMLAEVAS